MRGGHTKKFVRAGQMGGGRALSRSAAGMRSEHASVPSPADGSHSHAETCLSQGPSEIEKRGV